MASATDPVLVSMHLPKTAGTSFRKSLIERFGRKMIVCYRGQAYSQADVIFEFSGPVLMDLSPDDQKKLNEYCRKNGSRCFHGHFSLTPIWGVIDNPVYITFIREPFDRMISAFNYLRKSRPGAADHFTFEKFIEHDKTKNVYQSLGLADHFDDMHFVGITEQFNRSLLLLEKKFPYIGKLSSERANVSDKKSFSIDDVDDSLLEKFVDYNYIDLELYDKALARFEQECAEYGV